MEKNEEKTKTDEKNKLYIKGKEKKIGKWFIFSYIWISDKN